MPNTLFSETTTEFLETHTDTLCRICGDAINPNRANLGKKTCFACQCDLDRTEPVKHLVAIPYGKGAYQHIYNPAELFDTNQKQPRGE